MNCFHMGFSEYETDQSHGRTCRVIDKCQTCIPITDLVEQRFSQPPARFCAIIHCIYLLLIYVFARCACMCMCTHVLTSVCEQVVGRAWAFYEVRVEVRGPPTEVGPLLPPCGPEDGTQIQSLQQMLLNQLRDFLRKPHVLLFDERLCAWVMPLTTCWRCLEFCHFVSAWDRITYLIWGAGCSQVTL